MKTSRGQSSSSDATKMLIWIQRWRRVWWYSGPTGSIMNPGTITTQFYEKEWCNRCRVKARRRHVWMNLSRLQQQCYSTTDDIEPQQRLSIDNDRSNADARKQPSIKTRRNKQWSRQSNSLWCLAGTRPRLLMRILIGSKSKTTNKTDWREQHQAKYQEILSWLFPRWSCYIGTDREHSKTVPSKNGTLDGSTGTW